MRISDWSSDVCSSDLLSALRSRVLTIIDTAALVQGRHAEAQPDSYAIITNIAGHSYGMIVDSVSDIAPVPGGELALRGQLDAAWRPFAQQMVENEQGPHLLITLVSFIDNGPPMRSEEHTSELQSLILNTYVTF